MSLTIILPTLNEGNNIGVLIKQLLDSFSDIENFQILVIDDQSTDSTHAEVKAISNMNSKVELFIRNDPDGLTGAIKFGIARSTSEYIGWMDADGSMPASALLNLWRAIGEGADLALGSRFVTGGGFKGVTDESKNLFTIYRNLKDSNDSLLSVLLSRILNLLLRFILSNRLKDYTSGFIIIRREKIAQQDLDGYYGEYCPVFLFKCLKRDLIISEVPYINLPRQYGTSKTGTKLPTLIRVGIPYLTSAVKVRVKLSKTKIFLRR